MKIIKRDKTDCSWRGKRSRVHHKLNDQHRKPQQTTGKQAVNGFPPGPPISGKRIKQEGFRFGPKVSRIGSSCGVIETGQEVLFQLICDVELISRIHHPRQGVQLFLPDLRKLTFLIWGDA